MNTSSIQALGYLEVGVTDLEAWRRFAEQILGVACIDADGALHLRYDDDAWRVRLVETGEDDLRCAGFTVGSLADLEAIGNRLEAGGVEISAASPGEASERGVQALLRCRDPWGLPIELYVGERAAVQPFASPIGVAGFVTGEQGLGHMVLSAPDPARAESFYVRGLGFRLSDHIVMGPPGRQITITFLHCNPRHHTLALAPVPAPKRLNHILLQVTSIDDVGRALDRARTADVAITSSLGRHTNDRMISFYVQTPSGFEVEYGYGGIEIDDATWQPETYDAPSLWGHKGRLN